MDREARLRSAIEAYKNGEHKTIGGAATAHDVNRSTLTDDLMALNRSQRPSNPDKRYPQVKKKALLAGYSDSKSEDFLFVMI